MKKRLFIAAAAVLSILLLLTGCVKDIPASAQPAQSTSAAVAGESQQPIQLTENFVDTRHTITVAAQGEKKLMPDVAYVTVGVVSMNAKLKAAQDDNRTKMDAIYKALEGKGITKDNIRTSSYNVNQQYDYTNNKTTITGYEVNNMVEITLDDIGSVGDILDACQAAGANTAYPIRFALKDNTAAYNEALKTAVDKAKAKADLIASSTSTTITGVIKVDESGSNANPVYNYPADYARAAPAASAAPATQIDAGELTVSASVTVIYETKQ